MDVHTGATMCFRCGTKCGAPYAISRLTNISYIEARRALFDEGTVEYANDGLMAEFSEPRQDAITDADFAVADDIPVVILDQMFHPLATSAVRYQDYAISRGVTEDMWARYDLRGHEGMDGLTFPYWFKNKIRGAQTRKVAPQEGGPRMLSTPGMPKARMLWNYDNAGSCPNIVIAEGPFDAVKADQWQEGFCGLASFGKAVSAEQVALLMAAPAQAVYIGLDRDASDEAGALASLIAPLKTVYRVLPPGHRKDLGDCTREEALQALEDAVPLDGDHTANLEVFIR
jgi:hypothetical protein